MGGTAESIQINLEDNSFLGTSARRKSTEKAIGSLRYAHSDKCRVFSLHSNF